MEKEQLTVKELFDRFPELNASGVARRAGIAPCQMHYYKMPNNYMSKERLDIIRHAIRSLAEDLQSIEII